MNFYISVFLCFSASFCIFFLLLLTFLFSSFNFFFFSSFQLWKRLSSLLTYPIRPRGLSRTNLLSRKKYVLAPTLRPPLSPLITPHHPLTPCPLNDVSQAVKVEEREPEEDMAENMKKALNQMLDKLQEKIDKTEKVPPACPMSVCVWLPPLTLTLDLPSDFSPPPHALPTLSSPSPHPLLTHPHPLPTLTLCTRNSVIHSIC